MTIKERDVIFWTNKLLSEQWIGFTSTVFRCALSFEKQPSQGRLEFYTVLFSFWLVLWFCLIGGSRVFFWFWFVRLFSRLGYSYLKNLALRLFLNKCG